MANHDNFYLCLAHNTAASLILKNIEIPQHLKDYAEEHGITIYSDDTVDKVTELIAGFGRAHYDLAFDLFEG